MNQGNSIGHVAEMPPSTPDGVAATAPAVHSVFAPRPGHLEETGLSKWMLGDLVCKHLMEAGVLDLGEIAQRVALSGRVVEELLHFLRAEGRVELRSRRDNSPLLRFGLTDAGRNAALDAAQRDGYVGPAPITLAHYKQLIQAQSPRRIAVTREKVAKTFEDTVIQAALLERLGPAVCSGRAIFIYGEPGTGKTFIARRLHRLLDTPMLLPHAVAVGEHVIAYLDPSVHVPIDVPGNDVGSGRLSEGFDNRLVLCERPFVVVGGELTMDLLTLQFDESSRGYAAPLQLKANGGLFLIDDLGRQQVRPETLLNRWIIPMEEKRDQLSLRNGRHFSVPFDLTLVFSTNLQPRDLADEAFLRRIGYKVRFAAASRDDYAAIWQQVCGQLGIDFDEQLLHYAWEQLHAPNATPLMQCYPRDLLQLATDRAAFIGASGVDRESLDWAWQNYFLEG